MKRTKRVSRYAEPSIKKECAAVRSGKVICLPAETEWSAAAVEERYRFVGPVTDKPIFVSEGVEVSGLELLNGPRETATSKGQRAALRLGAHTSASGCLHCTSTASS